jgi:tRNA(fMet)-specific endonuclease VapC
VASGGTPSRQPAMNAAIVDTDVVSMLFKGDTWALAYRPHITGRLLGISFMTLAELERWSLERDWGWRRQRKLAQHLTRYAVLPVSRELCGKWAAVSFAAKRKGRPIQTADAWIAASAVHYQVPLITNNRAGYSAVDGSSRALDRALPKTQPAEEPVILKV